MKYYDLVFNSCRMDDGAAKRLGFERIFQINANSICMSSDKSRLIREVRDDAKAVAVTDFYIDRKLIAEMRERGTVLCIPFAQIISMRGEARSKALYRAGELLRYAAGSRIAVSFASFADSPLYMNSPTQLIELAKMLGAKEEAARESLGRVNMELGEFYGKGQA